MRLFFFRICFSFGQVYIRTIRFFMTYLPPPPFTMLRTSYSAKIVVWYGGNNIVLRGKGVGDEYKVSKIFALDCRVRFKYSVFGLGRVIYLFDCFTYFYIMFAVYDVGNCLQTIFKISHLHRNNCFPRSAVRCPWSAVRSLLSATAFYLHLLTSQFDQSVDWGGGGGSIRIFAFCRKNSSL